MWDAILVSTLGSDPVKIAHCKVGIFQYFQWCYKLPLQVFSPDIHASLCRSALVTVNNLDRIYIEPSSTDLVHQTNQYPDREQTTQRWPSKCEAFQSSPDHIEDVLTDICGVASIAQLFTQRQGFVQINCNCPNPRFLWWQTWLYTYWP